MGGRNKESNMKILQKYKQKLVWTCCSPNLYNPAETNLMAKLGIAINYSYYAFMAQAANARAAPTY